MRTRAGGSRESITELTQGSSFIFSGTVLELGRSNLRVIQAREGLALVRVDRGLRVDPALGDPAGRVVTVDTGDSVELRPGDQAVFFTESWIHGDELAVHELAHLPIDTVEHVVAEVDRLPELHLLERLIQARVVVRAVVTQTARVPNLPRERRAPYWAEAKLRVTSTLKGDARGKRLFFPTSDSHHWYGAPRFRRGRRGVFLLHDDDPRATRWLDTSGVDRNVLTALDPADVQPESELEHVRTLLTRIHR
jgi:hypothetical protein